MPAEPQAIESKRRELLLVAPVYFGLALIGLRAKLIVTPSWFDGTLERNHQLLLQYQYTNNEQSRLLQFYVPELFHRLFALSLQHAYVLQRWLFVFLALLSFHLYMRKWFDAGWTMAGVVLLAAVMPLGYANDLQESYPLLLLTFVLALWCVREGKLARLLAVYAVGGLNNETMLILPLGHFFLEAKRLGAAK